MEEKDWTGLLDILSVKTLKLVLGGDEALAIPTQSAAISKIVLESLGMNPGARAFVQERPTELLIAYIRSTGDCALNTHVLQERTVLKQLAQGSADRGNNMDTLVAEAKRCHAGPLFHFRISSVGAKVMTEVTSQAAAQQGLATFDRRWGLLTAEMRSLASALCVAVPVKKVRSPP